MTDMVDSRTQLVISIWDVDRYVHFQWTGWPPNMTCVGFDCPIHRLMVFSRELTA